MKKFISVLCIALFVSTQFFFTACSEGLPTKEQLVGTWKHTFVASSVNINNGEPITQNHSEIFRFKSDGTFVFGEYGDSPLFEVEGKWQLSEDKKYLVLSYDNGETVRIDIRDFDGNSFVTTSMQGNDFQFIKE